MPLSMRFSQGRTPKGAELSRGKRIDFAIRKLKLIDKEVYKEFTDEFRTEAKKIAADLMAQPEFPKRGSPLSGFAPRVLGKRTSNADYLDKYRYRKPTVKIVIGSRHRGSRRRTRPVVAIRFQSKAAGFQIMELAGTKNPGGKTYRGRNLIEGLKTAGYPLGDGGRFVIPNFYARKPQIMNTAERVLLKYSEKVSKELAQEVRRAQRMAR